MWSINANFDILYLSYNIKTKYNELNSFEVNILLYLAQLLSIYDGHSSNEWGYLFTNNCYGSPLCVEVLTELENLCNSRMLEKDSEGFYKIADNSRFVERLGIFSNQYLFSWRVKYIQCVIDSIMLKTLPQVTDAIQNEPGIANLKRLDRHSTLHDISDEQIDSLFDDFKILKEVIGDSRDQILIPASIWIDYLCSK